jgi:hypothetical protein
VLPVIDADVCSAYPASFLLLGGPGVLSARALRIAHDATPVMAVAAQAAAGDFDALFERSTYASLGLGLCEVLPTGERWPIELSGSGSPRFGVWPTRSPVPLPFAWGDFVNAAVLSRRVSKLASFTALKPRRARPGTEADWITAAVQRRSRAKDRLRCGQGKADDLLTKVHLHPVVNSGAWGVFARADQHRRSGGQGRPPVIVEEAAEWSWPALSVSVPALPRLWLGMVQRWVEDRRGICVGWDTDGVTLLSSADGGTHALRDGRVVRVLPHADIEAFLSRFDALDPFGDGRPFWEVEK